MKKIVSLFILLSLFTFGLHPAAAEVNAEEKIEVNKVISVDVTYDSWDEAKSFGEYYKSDSNNTLLKVKCAYRIGNTKRFIVTYSNEY